MQISKNNYRMARTKKRLKPQETKAECMDVAYTPPFRSPCSVKMKKKSSLLLRFQK